MRPTNINQHLLHPAKIRIRKPGDWILTALSGIVGAFIGLLMGMTALVAFLGKGAASEAGEPGMLLIKVLIVGTFVILFVILFMKGSENLTDEDKIE